MHFWPTSGVTLHMSVFPCQQRGNQDARRPERARGREGSEEQRVEEGGGRGGVWWFWDALLGASPEVTSLESCCRKTFHPFSFSVLLSASLSPSEFPMTQYNVGGRYLSHCLSYITDSSRYGSFRTNYRRIFFQIISQIWLFFLSLGHSAVRIPARLTSTTIPLLNHISCLLLLSLPSP